MMLAPSGPGIKKERAGDLSPALGASPRQLKPRLGLPDARLPEHPLELRLPVSARHPRQDVGVLLLH